MKKKYGFLLALCLLLCLLLCACGTRSAPGSTPPVEESAPTPTPTAAPKQLPTVEISEVMASNKATIMDDEGNFPDWLELHNSGESLVTLQNCSLERDGKSWDLPAIAIPADSHYLLLCSKLEDMTIPKAGCTLRLKDREGDVIDQLELPSLEEDQSACREVDGSLRISRFATPGEANTDEGYCAFQDSRKTPEGVPVINEVMVYNDRYTPVRRAYYDWVEIVNPGEEIITLNEFYLSDKSSDHLLYRLPKMNLKPGRRVLIYCSAEGFADKTYNSGFSLNREHETLFLSRDDGSVVDYVNLHDIPLACSFGRLAGKGGFFYMNWPTPNGDNVGGGRLISQMPEALTADGVYEDADSVRVELASDDPIHYTLDGTTPTLSSPLYTEAFSVTETCVVRAAAFHEGYLPSRTLDLSYILREGHSLPVVSLVVAEDEMFGDYGMYRRVSEEVERGGTFTLFADGERSSIYCGVKLHGETSKVNQAKKSFKLKFADRYEGAFDCDVFGNGVTHFASLILRADQEIPGEPDTSYLHDVVMHELASECFPALPVQDHRYAVLYINGKYWGIYSIREAHSATHLAQHYGYDESQVYQSQGGWGTGTQVDDIYLFAIRNDLRKAENYEYVAQYLDLDSIIGWCMMEGYCGNEDSMRANMRFYWTEEDQKLHFGLVDLDLGFFDRTGLSIPFGLGFQYNQLVSALLRNEDFRDRMFTQFHDSLMGGMSDEKVNAKIDELAAEIRSEIPRDTARWHFTPEIWEGMVQDMHHYVDKSGGRAWFLIDGIRGTRWVSKEDADRYFGDILAKGP